jgi:hypothetical protein
MIAVADHIDTIVCATVIEAQVRELRLISENRPQYNRRSKAQEKATWAKVVEKPAPRFALVRGSELIDDSVNWIGPFSGKEDAGLAIDAINYCLETPNDFAKNDVRSIVSKLNEKMHALALDEIPELVAAQPIFHNDVNSWEFVCIRHGRLAGSATSKIGVDISHTIASLVASAEVVSGGASILPASTYEEVEILLSYLESEGVRLVSIEGEWSSPVFGAGSARYELEKLRNRDQEAANFWESAIQRSRR